MNKPSNKKLQLGRETLIALQSQDLAGVAGGADAGGWLTKFLCPSQLAGTCTTQPTTTQPTR